MFLINGISSIEKVRPLIVSLISRISCWPIAAARSAMVITFTFPQVFKNSGFDSNCTEMLPSRGKISDLV